MISEKVISLVPTRISERLTTKMYKNALVFKDRFTEI